MSVYNNPLHQAEARLLLRSFELGQAQHAIEEVDEAYRKELNAVEWLKARERENATTDASTKGDGND